MKVSDTFILLYQPDCNSIMISFANSSGVLLSADKCLANWAEFRASTANSACLYGHDPGFCSALSINLLCTTSKGATRQK